MVRDPLEKFDWLLNITRQPDRQREREGGSTTYHPTNLPGSSRKFEVLLSTLAVWRYLFLLLASRAMLSILSTALWLIRADRRGWGEGDLGDLGVVLPGPGPRGDEAAGEWRGDGDRVSRLEDGLMFLGDMVKGDTLLDLTIPGDFGASW